MTSILNRLIVGSLIVFFIGVLVFVFYDVKNKSDLTLVEDNKPQKKSLVSKKEVGVIKVLQGKVVIKSQTGEEKILGSGDKVAVGDLIKTGAKTETQIEFPDKSQLILYENTELKIVNFDFVKGKPGSHISKLIKGQLRAISGLIGKRKGDKYQMRSSIATIGIRGTDYTLRLCNKNECKAGDTSVESGLYMAVIDGEIVASSDAGDTAITKGELFHQVRKDNSAEKIKFIPGLLASGKLVKAAKPVDSSEWILEEVQ